MGSRGSLLSPSTLLAEFDPRFGLLVTNTLNHVLKSLERSWCGWTSSFCELSVAVGAVGLLFAGSSQIWGTPPFLPLHSRKKFICIPVYTHMHTLTHTQRHLHMLTHEDTHLLICCDPGTHHHEGLEGWALTVGQISLKMLRSIFSRAVLKSAIEISSASLRLGLL